MKLNTLFVAAVCASTLLASCNPKTAVENQLKYTHTSLVDAEAYSFFQIVGSKIPYEVDYAKYVETKTSSTQVKQLAAKVQVLYGSLIPQMDSLAIESDVDFPIKGAQKFSAVAQAESATTDSTAVSAHAEHAPYSDEAYLLHVQHETAKIKDQFERLSRNTNRSLRDFAAAQIEAVGEVYTLAGGKAEAHGHH